MTPTAGRAAARDLRLFFFLAARDNARAAEHHLARFDLLATALRLQEARDLVADLFPLHESGDAVRATYADRLGTEVSLAEFYGFARAITRAPRRST